MPTGAKTPKGTDVLTRFRMAAWLPLAAATALIVACGGGGGGGGTEAASPPASSPTGNTGGLLAFTPRNAGYVAEIGRAHV